MVFAGSTATVNQKLTNGAIPRTIVVTPIVKNT